MNRVVSVVQWHSTEEGLRPVLAGEPDRTVAWAPQPGSQEAFLSCPIPEAIYEGTRGPGKTDALLMDYAQHVGLGFGQAWRGILFRRTYPELQDVIDKALRWFPLIWPGARYNRSEHYWTFPEGEQLFLRHFDKERDYWSYHGHEYPWQGWEELTTWPDDKGYKKMFSCARTTHRGLPIKIRSTTNPYGVGHNWVKARWRLPIMDGTMVGPVIRDSRDRDGHLELPRVVVHGELRENQILLTADPDYVTRLRSAARNKAELRAWLYGDWNIVAGGMFDDVWDESVHVLPSAPLSMIPKQWRIDRSYDHGQSKPFSVGWWAESNGEPWIWIDPQGKRWVFGPVRGDLIRVAEWYGWRKGQANEGLRMKATHIAQGILEREDDWGVKGRVKPGPADRNIFDDYEPELSVAGDMKSKSVKWEMADMGAGSRKQGWEQMRKLLEQAQGGQRDEPGLFVMERCEDGFRRTVPVLPRDDRDLDDVDTDAEDHTGDETRYRVRWKRKTVQSGSYK